LPVLFLRPPSRPPSEKELEVTRRCSAAPPPPLGCKEEKEAMEEDEDEDDDKNQLEACVLGSKATSAKKVTATRHAATA